MKDCDIVKDLLPLVAEDMASESTKEYVNNHLETCETCRKAYEEMKTPVEAEPAAPLKTVKKAVKKRGLLIAGLIACLVTALLIGVFARLTKPIVIHSADEAFVSVKTMPEISAQNENAGMVLYLTHNESTHVKIENTQQETYKSDFQRWLERWIPGEKIVVMPQSREISIYAYTTLWDQLITQSDTWTGFGISLTHDVDAVFFEPFDNSDRQPLYLREGYEPEAGFALPRLVMNYYFAIALAGTVALAVVWFVLRLLKKKKVSSIFGVLLIIAASGVLAFLFAGFPATTIEPLRDLIFVCVIATLLIGAGLSARALLKKG